MRKLDQLVGILLVQVPFPVRFFVWLLNAIYHWDIASLEALYMMNMALQIASDPSFLALVPEAKGYHGASKVLSA